MSKKEIYFSIDIEADGPIPGLYSMLSFAAVAFTVENHKIKILDTFEANLETLDGARQHPDTMVFWSKFPDAYLETRKNTQNPSVVMAEFVYWVNSFSAIGKPIGVGFPAVYDFSWINWYLHYFTGGNPLGFAALDMKSYANSLLKHKHFSSTSKRTMPKNWFNPDRKHTHIAIDDALEQAELFVQMRKQALTNE